jgi:hypothetical protein
MTYRVRHGRTERIPKHNQARVDAYCREVMDQSLPVSPEEAKALLGKPGVVLHMMTAHEDHCRTLKTGIGNDCTCTPAVSFHKLATKGDVQ